ncbi:hypothetical protein FH972_012913 [Carpinus fangiana]|uniref:Uncharacterized protein n=1 Tax=Carpinus fangiana TaxID=176857 RepID=A0A5N6R8G6_9ROSI|nr:hypothetical protein FH972_012913 [Carpinus fangiana]
MADSLSVILASVLRNLSNKLYEKCKNAALEVKGIVKQLTTVERKPEGKNLDGDGGILEKIK